MGQGGADNGNIQGFLSITTPLSCYEGISRVSVFRLYLWITSLPKLEQCPKKVKRPEVSTHSRIHNPNQISNPQLLHSRVWLINSLKSKLPGGSTTCFCTHGLVISLSCFFSNCWVQNSSSIIYANAVNVTATEKLLRF